MPAMITHYLLGKRLLLESDIPPIPSQEAFLLGVQGPDVFYFHRAYPWLIGEKGFDIGMALHDVQPSVLVQAFRDILKDTPPEELAVVTSYVYGFLCHYAADRLIHPFVIDMQDKMQNADPTFAADSNPYHYRIESALDAHLLRRDRGEYVTAYSLRSLVPKKDKQRDGILAKFYQRLIAQVLDKDVSLKWLSHVTEDFRHSMWLMTDHTELKGKAIRFAERCAKSGAKLSPLLRTKDVEWYDYINEKKASWKKDENTFSEQTFFELCDETVMFTVSLFRGYANGEEAVSLTGDIDFSGMVWKERER